MKGTDVARIPITAQLVRALSLAVGTTLDVDQLGGIADDPTDGSSGHAGGCISSLAFGPKGALKRVGIKRSLVGPGTPIHPVLYLEDGFPRSDSIKVTNLTEYQVQFETALNRGHSVQLMISRAGVVTEFIAYPCHCGCSRSVGDSRGTKAYGHENPGASMDPLPSTAHTPWEFDL
jgi:hypothetical protein